MISILVSFLGENISITIDDGEISIDSKTESHNDTIRSIFSDCLASYSPADGFFGKYMAMELVKNGAKILKVSDPEEDEGDENTVY
jgi:hypothetical protein